MQASSRSATIAACLRRCFAAQSVLPSHGPARRTLPGTPRPRPAHLTPRPPQPGCGPTGGAAQPGAPPQPGPTRCASSTQPGAPPHAPPQPGCALPARLGSPQPGCRLGSPRLASARLNPGAALGASALGASTRVRPSAGCGPRRPLVTPARSQSPTGGRGTEQRTQPTQRGADGLSCWPRPRATDDPRGPNQSASGRNQPDAAVHQVPRPDWTESAERHLTGRPVCVGMARHNPFRRAQHRLLRPRVHERQPARREAAGQERFQRAVRDVGPTGGPDRDGSIASDRGNRTTGAAPGQRSPSDAGVGPQCSRARGAEQGVGRRFGDQHPHLLGHHASKQRPHGSARIHRDPTAERAR